MLVYNFDKDHLHTMSTKVKEHIRAVFSEKVNGAGSTIKKVWDIFMEDYSQPILEYCLRTLHTLYMQLTLINTVIFIIKYVPTGLYMCKFIKDVYVTSRERIKQKQIEIDEIQLQIQIVNTKLCVRDTEFADRSEQLRLGAEKLRKVRASVRELIAADEVLHKALDNAAQWDADTAYLNAISQEEERELFVELLKEFKYDHLLKPEIPSEHFNSNERSQMEDNTSENSVYSSISDIDTKQDCRVKIVKVSNVYKIACLKYYIKQKRLRRANKNALLRKKMENIKDLLEDWQKTLNMVINSKLTILNIDSHPMDVASQEAMGDYSKPLGSSDTDSDIRNSWSDMYDEYSFNWMQNPYKPYSCNYEDGPDDASKELYDAQNYGDGFYQTNGYCDPGKVRSPNMVSITEETNSQIAVEEVRSESDDEYERRDLVMI